MDNKAHTLILERRKGGKRMQHAANLLRADLAWRNGFTGRGVTAAVLDTGISPGHPDLKGRISCFRDFVNARKQPYDDCGHGTHVSGILAGEGRIKTELKGIAPGTGLVCLKVLDRSGNGKREHVLKGIDWVIRNRERYGIRIMNISVGTVRKGDGRDRRLEESVEAAWDAGIVVICAAGNLGPQERTITSPGNSRKVITVGCSDEMREWHSGRGPTEACICKPDIVAPGNQIWSCNAFYGKAGQYYCKKSGTSMATPMISGAAALLLEKEPWLSNVEVKMRLRETARDLGLPKNMQGWGRMDVGDFLLL